MSKERELLKKILKNTVYMDYACNSKIRTEIQKFLDQPEQEGLSEDEIDKAYQQSCGNYCQIAFKDGVRFAEQYYGIGGVENEKV